MRLLAALMIAALTTNASAQEQTLFGDEKVEHGGYGAMVAGATSVNNEFAVLMGGRGAWIINHSFAIGFGGYGLANNIRGNNPGPFGQPYVSFGYGGLDLEMILNSDDLVHFSIHSLFGGGSVGFRGGLDDDRFEMDEHDADMFFVLEPGINLDLNVTPWFRASAGVNYRYVSGVASGAATNSSLAGSTATLSLRFGKF